LPPHRRRWILLDGIPSMKIKTRRIRSWT
jgi:hypothetical protein